MHHHPEIPVGTYCYISLGTEERDGKVVLKTKVCPHWHRTDNGARCDLINEEHYTYCPFHLLWDQVKECGINRYEPGDESDRETARRTIACPCNREVEIIDLKGKKDESCK